MTPSHNAFGRPEASSQETAVRVNTLSKKTSHTRGVLFKKGNTNMKTTIIDPATKTTIKEAREEEFFGFTRLNKKKLHKLSLMH